MQIQIYWIGKTGKGFNSEGVKLYENRLKHYTKLQVTEIQDIKNKSSFDPELLKKKESELLLTKIPEKAYLILLDEKGIHLSSRDFADKLAHMQQHSGSEVCFLIGGAFGVDDEIKKRANLVLSFSKMTFSHQFIRVMLLEQLYRAFTIIRGEKYHND